VIIVRRGATRKTYCYGFNGTSFLYCGEKSTWFCLLKKILLIKNFRKLQ